MHLKRTTIIHNPLLVGAHFAGLMTRSAYLWPCLIVAPLIALSASNAVGGLANPIQPGDSATSQGAGCTLNFVFDGPNGEVYVGIAAHCVNGGALVSTPGYVNFGTVVYDNDGPIDFALIRVHANNEASVDPSVRGHPTFPTGVAEFPETFAGDLLRFSGYGVGFSNHPLTREQRVGVLVTDSTVHYCSEAPVSFGDSGGPVLHDATGKALGIVSGTGFGCASWLTGPTVSGAIAAAGSAGFPVTLRTV